MTTIYKPLNYLQSLQGSRNVSIAVTEMYDITVLPIHYIQLIHKFVWYVMRALQLLHPPPPPPHTHTHKSTWDGGEKFFVYNILLES